jgi:SAM-dependent methyltransferase
VRVPPDPFPVGDPFRFSTIAHADREILGPASAGELEDLIDAAGVTPGARVLDIGCGKGDLLVRLARRGATGSGIDRNAAFLADARALALAAGVGDRLRFELADAATATATATPGSDLDLVACVGATGALGGPVDAPARLAAMVRRGGTVIIGEGLWRREPEAAWLAEFGVEPDELLDLAGTLGRMTAAGLEVVATRQASQEGWDAYEEAYAGAVERWAAANPDDPEHDAFLERAAFFRRTWAAWRRDAMGFVTVVLRR